MGLGTFWATYHDLVAILASSLLGVAALVVAWAQARDSRLLDLHEKMTTGQIGDSVHRLSAHLYEGDPGAAARRLQWSELQALNGAKCPKCQATIDDAFNLLWFFARMNRAVGRPVVGAITGLVPYKATKEMLGWHIVWWAIAFETVTQQQARFSGDLQALSRRIDPSGELRNEALGRFQLPTK